MSAAYSREDVLETMLDQAIGTIEFLHGCLTDPHVDGVPGGFTYGYPEQTLARLVEFRTILPESRVCFHSKSVEGCEGCAQGERHRAIMAAWREGTLA